MRIAAGDNHWQRVELELNLPGLGICQGAACVASGAAHAV